MCAGKCSLFMGRLVSGIVKQRKCLFIKNRSTEGELTISFWQNNFATMNWALGTLEVYETYLSLIDLNVSQNSSCGTKVWKFFRTTQKKRKFNLWGPKNTQSWSMKLKRFMIFSCASCWMNEIGRILKRNPQGKERANKIMRKLGKLPVAFGRKVFKCHPHYFELQPFRLMRWPRLRFVWEPIQKGPKRVKLIIISKQKRVTFY